MKIYVRDADGYVLNSYAFNSQMDYDHSLEEGVNERIFEREYYKVYDVDLTLDTDEAKEGFCKKYYYNDGVLTLKYSATGEVDEILKGYEDELASTDYIIVKAYERVLTNQPTDTQYDYEAVMTSRQALRDKINELREMKEKYPTIVTYNEEYMRPINEYV